MDLAYIFKAPRLTTEEMVVDDGDRMTDAPVHEPILRAGDKKFEKSNARTNTINWLVSDIGLSKSKAQDVTA